MISYQSLLLSTIILNDILLLYLSLFIVRHVIIETYGEPGEKTQWFVMQMSVLHLSPNMLVSYNITISVVYNP